MQWVKARVAPLLIAAALFLSFRYLAEFSLKQSIALTVSTAVAWGFCIYLLATRHVQPPFQPFYVRVVPNWYELLRDHKLIRDDQDRQALQAEIERAPASEYSVLRNGIMFTVLKAEAHSFWPRLIYSNDRRNFLAEVDFCEPIDRIGAPGLYIKSGVHGYDLGLTVLNIVPGGIEPTRRLHIATIPYEEFCFYWYRPELLVRHLEKFQKRRDQLLVETGWKRRDVGAPKVNVIEHKYFTVWHQSI